MQLSGNNNRKSYHFSNHQQQRTIMKKHLKNFKNISIAALAGLSLLAPVHAALAAQSVGTTTLTVTIPPFAILYYPNSIAMTLKDKTDADGVNTSQNLLYNEETGAMDLEVDPGTAPSNSTSITLANVWAVRGLSTGGNATVAITSTASTLTLSNGGTISIGTLKVNNTETSATVALTGMTPVKGSVGMTIDMANATRSGTFTGGSYTLTVTVI
jgi:hypothetical protein